MDAATNTTIETIIEQVSERVISQLAPRLDEHDRRIDEVTTTVRLAAASVTTMLQQIADPPSPPPSDRPAALDDACNAPTGAGRQRVVVDVAGRTVTEYVEPGSDPARVWDEMRNAVLHT